MYTCLPRHTCPYRAINTRIHIYISVRACTRRWAADKRRWSRRCACVCASRHPCMPGCTSVDTAARCTDGHTTTRARTCTQAHIRTLPWNLRAHSCTYMYSYVRRCMHAVIHVWWARACAHLHGIYTYIHMHMHLLAHIPTHMVNHISRSPSCRAASPAARANTQRTDAQARARTLKCILRAHPDLCTYTYMHIYIYINI